MVLNSIITVVALSSDLRDFIRALEEKRELKRIPFEVDPILEITEFADRAVKQGGPALLFEKPKGYDIPVLINCLRLHAQDGDRAGSGLAWKRWRARIVEFLEMRMPEGLIGKLKMLPKLAEMGAFFPESVSARALARRWCARSGFSLLDYPVLQCWPEDGGRFITLPLVFSRNPDTGKRNCGMYRMQIFDERTAGMHWQTHKQGAEHYRRMRQHGRKRMDVAVAIGADPATMYSAILPLPPDLDEMMIAGFLRQSPVEMVKCQTCDLEVPAQCRDRAGGLRGVGRTAHRRAVRRPHRLLFAGRRVPGIPRHLHHAARATPSTPPPSWDRRPWRITTWARRSSASSCR